LTLQNAQALKLFGAVGLAVGVMWYFRKQGKENMGKASIYSA
jgi:hypothetical protein